MNCQQCQRHLLSSERLDSQPPDITAHLAECAGCRHWQKHLVQIESHVPALPLPVSQGREQFLQRFLIDDPILRRQPAPAWPRRRVFAWTSVAAAAVILIACAVALMQGSKRTEQPVAEHRPKGPRISDRSLAGRLLELDLKLAEADSPRQRIKALAQVADNLQGESRALAKVGGPKDLDALAKMYETVVRDGIVTRARQLPAQERRAALRPISEQLTRTKEAVEKLAARAQADAAAPLLVIAAAARNGDRELRDLIQEATP